MIDWFQIIGLLIVGFLPGFTAGLLIALHQLESIIRKTRMEEAEAQDGFPFQ